MANKDPLQPIFEEIRKLLSLLYEKSGDPLKETIPPEVQTRLSELEKVVDKLKEKSEEHLRHSGIESPLAPKKIMGTIKQMPEADKKALETSFALGREASSLYLGFLSARKKVAEKEKKKKESVPIPTKKEISKRKTKFRKIKGDQTWKKL